MARAGGPCRIDKFVMQGLLHVRDELFQEVRVGESDELPKAKNFILHERCICLAHGPDHVMAQSLDE
jgi:hypothetical protein